jgi:hypothetical protein
MYDCRGVQSWWGAALACTRRSLVNYVKRYIHHEYVSCLAPCISYIRPICLPDELNMDAASLVKPFGSIEDGLLLISTLM